MTLNDAILAAIGGHTVNDGCEPIIIWNNQSQRNNQLEV